MDSTAKAEKIAAILDERKAIDIQKMKVEDYTIITDWFIVCSGTSTTHIKALCGEIEEKMSALGEKCIGIEGFQTARWILMDYGDVIVHIFHRDEREFYDIEKLWDVNRLRAIKAEEQKQEQ